MVENKPNYKPKPNKTMSKTQFSYPVERLCGKISKNSKVIHSCTASGKQITYLQGERDLNAHPVSAAEIERQKLFKKRQAAVAARIDHKAETYEADMAAYREQYKEGYKSFSKYIWSLVKAEITE